MVMGGSLLLFSHLVPPVSAASSPDTLNSNVEGNAMATNPDGPPPEPVPPLTPPPDPGEVQTTPMPMSLDT